MSRREEFEKEMCNEYSWFGETLELAHFHGDDATGYYTGGDYIYHGKSCADALFWAWRGWQASSTNSESQLTALTSQLESVVAENAALKDINAWCKTDAFKNMYREFKTAESLGCQDVDCMHDAMLTAIMHAPETPATDTILAEVRDSARNEGINYAASRLAAAYNHGFIDKPLAEVSDVVRMILDAKDELANATIPPADGLSGEYAEKSLAEFAAQLRQGGAV